VPRPHPDGRTILGTLRLPCHAQGMRIWIIYVAAAFTELAGCFAFWVWLRNGRSMLWVTPGVLALVTFAWLLTLVPIEAAGRAYAAYGGIYVAASLLWLRFVEGVVPDRWDIIGAAICILGAAVILLGPRAA
jgi:small multidrug resistance family-3 protein